MFLLDDRAGIHFGDLVASLPSSNGDSNGLKILSYHEGKVASHMDFPNPFLRVAHTRCCGKKYPELTEIPLDECPQEPEPPYCPVVIPLGCQEYHFGVFAVGSYNDKAIVTRNSRLFKILGIEMSRYLFATHMKRLVANVLFERDDDSMSFEALLTFKFKHLMDKIDPEIGGNILGEVITLVERILIQLSLEKTGHKLGQSAALLGINRNTLRKKIQALGLNTRDT